jgi:predicted nucleotidyltransferase
MKLSEKKKRLIVSYFRGIESVTEVHLIGSYARGDATRRSDIDLIVKTDGAAALPMAIARCKPELRALLAARIDIHEHHTLPKYVRRTILDGSVLLYARVD